MATADLAAGRAMRERQLDIFEQQDHQFLERCRTLAVLVCQQRGQASINDIRAIIEVPPGVHPSVLGAVFRTKQFKKIGLCEASHKEAHARVIRVYALAD
jgi:hypothetical protein